MNTPVTPLPANLTAEHERTEYVKDSYDVEWQEYVLTLTRAGRDYRIATLTEYPNGRALLLKDALIRTSTAHAAWDNLVRSVGQEPEYGRVMHVLEAVQS